MKINDKAITAEQQKHAERYDKMSYSRCGKSGVLLPQISLGLWHNFGGNDDLKKSEDILKTAFDNGIVHFDLANNYGPPYGSAERNFGEIFKKQFVKHRDELFIASKAGYDMWPGPYGNWGSRKYLISSLDQSLERMGLDYVDLFYHHRPDPNTPLEETMMALSHIVNQGKALYVGISNYDAETTAQASQILRELKVPFIIHQARYSIFDRWVENGLTDVLTKENKGLIAFSPLAQGMLTDKYLKGIPTDSRAARDLTYLQKETVLKAQQRIVRLADLSKARGQSLAQMAISWLLAKEVVTSVLVGASSSEQLLDSVQAIHNCDFTAEELDIIKNI
ncbi:aldo/keto reductase [Marinoscillum sp. MHG1-6]|uniref:aldo/keto reductase n=1 Tax=Marinoscillum sp. MHG1-6 TaxID=2959627 RepID=UPI00215837E7|nr:aldo/keto reductase [Marinoscillum sp. MHG1-6]